MVSSRRPHRTGGFRKDGTRWYGLFYVTDADGVRRQKERVLKNEDGTYAQSLTERTAALHRVRAALEASIAEQASSVGRAESMTLREAGEQYLGHLERHGSRRAGGKLKRKTTKDYEMYLRRHLTGPYVTKRGSRPLKNEPFFKDCLVGEITLEDVEAYIDQKIDEGHAGSTIELHLTLLTCIFRYAIKKGWATENPVPSRDDWPQDASPDEIEDDPHDAHSVEEVHAVVRACADDFERTLFMTAYYTGMRLGELQALTWAEVQFTNEMLANGVILIRRSWSLGEDTKPKSRHNRTLPMAAPVEQLLARHLEHTHYGSPGDRVFAHPQSGKVLDEGWIRKRFLAAQTSAGVHKIRLHDTRSTFATILWWKDTMLAEIQRLLGHADPATTQRYIKGYRERGDEAAIIEKAFSTMPELGGVTSLMGH